MVLLQLILRLLARASRNVVPIFKQRNANTHGMNDGGNIPNGPAWPGAGSQLPHPGSINNALPPGGGQAQQQRVTVGAMAAEMGLTLKRIMSGAEPIVQRLDDKIRHSSILVSELAANYVRFGENRYVRKMMQEQGLSPYGGGGGVDPVALEESLGEEYQAYMDQAFKLEVMTIYVPIGTFVTSAFGGFLGLMKVFDNRNSGLLMRSTKAAGCLGGGIVLGLGMYDLVASKMEDKADVMRTESPLLPGKVPVADLLCEGYMNIYGLAGQDFWQNYRKVLDGGNSSYEDQDLLIDIRNIEATVLNCARRSEFDKSRNRGFSSGGGLRGGSGRRNDGKAAGDNFGMGKSIAIPEPGVPRDLPINKYNIGTNDGQFTSEEWLESFATAMDQDEQFGQMIGLRTENAYMYDGGGMLDGGNSPMWGEQQQQLHQPWGFPGGINANNGKIETASDVFRKERQANGDDGGGEGGGEGDDDIDDER